MLHTLSSPNDVATKDLVKEVRSLSDKNGVDLLVTGSTAVNIDISDRLNDAIPVFAVLIVGFAFVLLTIVFIHGSRSSNEQIYPVFI